MYVNQVLKLSMTMDTERFRKVFHHCCCSADDLEKGKEDEYIDSTFGSEGMTVVFCDKPYKKKIKLYLDLTAADDSISAKKQVQRFEKNIESYFGSRYRISDFIFCGMVLTEDLDIGSRAKVAEYFKYLQRIRQVKGFSTIHDEQHEGIGLRGNSRAVKVFIYDLEKSRLSGTDKGSKGILRVKIKLSKPKEIRRYCDQDKVSEQMLELIKRKHEVFMDIFAQVIPFGDAYKKDKAEEIIRNEIDDHVMRRRMLRLLTLIPEKKSLYLAQKELNCRRVNEVMIRFAQINLSPVTLSKRQEAKYLQNLYEYL